MSRIFVGLLISTVLLFTWSSQANAHDPKFHGFNLVAFKKPFPAPAVTLANLAGEKISLSDLKGKIVLLNFWATWCPPCLAEMPSIQALSDRYSADDFAVVAISSDEEGATVVQPFIDKLKLRFAVLLDPNSEISALYGAKNLPVTFILDRDGNVISAATGSREWASEASFSTFDELVNAQ